VPKTKAPDALTQAQIALATAPDWRLVGLPVYEQWFKGPRQVALAALKDGDT
jgi:hypothetical protein